MFVYYVSFLKTQEILHGKGVLRTFKKKKEKYTYVTNSCQTSKTCRLWLTHFYFDRFAYIFFILHKNR